MNPTDGRYQALFVQEAETRLAQMARDLLALERGDAGEEAVDSLFREAHTLKGGAGLVGLSSIAELAHVVEDVLEALRSGAAMPTVVVVDALLAAVDGLRTMTNGALQPGAVGVDVEALGRRLRRAVSEGAAPDVVPPMAPADDGMAPAAAASPFAATLRIRVEDLDRLDRLAADTATGILRIGHLLSGREGIDPLDVPEFRDLARAVADLQQRVLRVRMVPVASLADALQRAVRDAARGAGRQVRWDLVDEGTALDRAILDVLVDPLLHLVRNAVVHGIEDPQERRARGKEPEGIVRLTAAQVGSDAILTVSDDGRGVDAAALRDAAAARGVDVAALPDDELLGLVFSTGVSTASQLSTLAGRGVGLDVVRTAVESIRGRVDVTSQPGVGTEFRLVVPITMSVVPCLLVTAGSGRYAIPVHAIHRAVEPEVVDAAPQAAGRPALWDAGGTVPVATLASVLGAPGGVADAIVRGPALVIAGRNRRYALRVDRLLGRRTVVLKELSRLLPRLEVVSGVSIEPDGSIVPVLDPAALVDRAARLAAPAPDGGRPAATPDADADGAGAAAAHTRQTPILVVDDTLTVRELQRSILERAGYRVRVAEDGVAALAALAEEDFGLVLTDVEMPRLDGLELTRAIRNHASLGNLPIVMLTAHGSEDDRRRGIEAGADAYVVKSDFDAPALLALVARLIGDER